MDGILLDIISESAALRRCNLPATNRWRNHLRRNLPHHEMGNGKVYNEHQVNAFSKNIPDLADEVIEVEGFPAPSLRELDAMN
ncbi:hypothetical protein N9080_04420 [Akkermansiaceae bacterium]|nr:hypothetical protein [Akkermansiaceae bacterium]